MKIKDIKLQAALASRHEGHERISLTISLWRRTLEDIIKDAGPKSKAGRKAKAALYQEKEL